MDKDCNEVLDIFKSHKLTTSFMERVAGYIFGEGNNFPDKTSSRMISPADTVLSTSSSGSRGGKTALKFADAEVGDSALNQLGGLAAAAKFNFPQNVTFTFASLLAVAGKETEVFHLLFGLWLLLFGTPYIDPVMKTRVAFIFFELSAGRFLLAKLKQMIKVRLATYSKSSSALAERSLSHALALTPS